LVQSELTKADVVKQAQILGAEYVGFASIDRWEDSQDAEMEFYPQNIWPLTKTVIVLAVPLELPGTAVLTSTALRQAQNKVANELLDEAAYRLAVFINSKGYPSVNIPQDSSGQDMSDQPTVEVFSHVWAGHYAGVGQISQHNTLVTREDGRQLNAVSILTSLELENDRLS
jgi:epoxyqueuosine reductase QueG